MSCDILDFAVDHLSSAKFTSYTEIELFLDVA